MVVVLGRAHMLPQLLCLWGTSLVPGASLHTQLSLSPPRAAVVAADSQSQLGERLGAQQEDMMLDEFERELGDAARRKRAKLPRARQRARDDVGGWFAGVVAAVTFGVVTPTDAFRGGLFGRLAGSLGIGIGTGISLDPDAPGDVRRKRR